MTRGSNAYLPYRTGQITGTKANLQLSMYNRCSLQRYSLHQCHQAGGLLIVVPSLVAPLLIRHVLVTRFHLCVVDVNQRGDSDMGASGSEGDAPYNLWDNVGPLDKFSPSPFQKPARGGK
ncbi:hypothetical protein PIB30_063385 [Stylosanthes scabra]|uniref:Uncharacterized protein n=1 Tax=Stylosanthes scabra TaxID=79078 RepID=A0ABU6XKE2_9FABA|nr:hypothetical protein [Stylosanthes scabra]